MLTQLENHHRQRPAYIYIRQSSIGQVRHHQESTERQYALKEKALVLGWANEMIQVLDGDLGISGAHGTDRPDFKMLVADVSMSKVGAIFALEASRLARSCLDWQRLIELCALTKTLVIDEDGCYDPADFNDGLLLGIKGTIAQAELHFIRARLHGGMINKANKGELALPPGIGLCYDDQGRIILDPDQEVQASIRQLFDIFRQVGSAFGVARRFKELGLRFPKRTWGETWKDKLTWAPLASSRSLYILQNPFYAGCYAYGRSRQTKAIAGDGEIRLHTVRVSRERWLVMIKDHHPGYISWEEFLKNQEVLERNRSGGPNTILSGPAREGAALLQGLLLCAVCGKRLAVRYGGHNGAYPAYECTVRRVGAPGPEHLIRVRCSVLDAPVVQRVLEVLQPAELEIALSALKELERRDNAVCKQWQMGVERAEYEAQLAERRYEEVDPSNRLVAGTLETRWNETLLRLDEAKAKFSEFQQQHVRVATPEQKARVLALAQDFPRVWNAPTTQPKDRKRMIRLVIKDITVNRERGSKQVDLHIRWQGGALEHLTVTVPTTRTRSSYPPYPPHIVEKVRVLSQTHPDSQTAEILNREGYVTTRNGRFHHKTIHYIRMRYALSAQVTSHPGELTVQEIADRCGVGTSVVYRWIKDGRLVATRRPPLRSLFIKLDTEKEQELRALIRNKAKTMGVPVTREHVGEDGAI